MQSLPAKQDLILVGGGHSHALVIRMLAMNPLPETRLTLISPDSLAPYSGMLPGLISGHYSITDSHIDLPRLCQWAGVRFIRARTTALDAHLRRLTLNDGSQINYDWLSLDIGSTPALDQVPGAREHGIAVKPVAHFRHRWQEFLDQTPKHNTTTRIAVVGGGAGGTEIALALHTALARRGRAANIQLICGSELLPGYPPRLQRAMAQRLANASIDVISQCRITRVTEQCLHADNLTLNFDTLFWCTGASGAGWLADSGLELDDNHFIRVEATLQSINQPTIFAAGDCAVIEQQPLPRAGVYAVRQAKVLAANLRSALTGSPLKIWRPQKRFLSLLSAGNGDAAGNRGILTVQGSWVWRWKDRIDRRFMAMFEQLPQRQMSASIASTEHDIQRCAGCGAKVGSEALQQALSGLQPVTHNNIMAGLNAREDASIIRWPSGQLLLQSQDFFPAFIDEPALFGRISVLHSLSDLYAMNAQPHSALATVSLPVNHQVLQSRDLKRLMRAAVDELNEAGCALVGGHTLEGPQLAAGFAVNGSGREDTLFHKGGGVAGDRLILTKPLGTGIILAGLMQHISRAPAVDGALESMLQSNAAAAAIFSKHGVRSCTDITGFGLLGHLLEMCQASGLSAELECETVPTLTGVMALIQRGVHSTLKTANDAVLTQTDCATRLLMHPLLTLLTDPQTSGGLLAAVSAQQVDGCLQTLKSAGIVAVDIGKLKPRQTRLLKLV